jgi:hypothetical protein
MSSHENWFVGAQLDAPAFAGEIWWIYPNPRFTDLNVNLLVQVA